MKTINDILTPEEVARYQEGWRNFRERYVLNGYVTSSEHDAHSGKPVIGLVYRFEDRPVFRAHASNRKLKRIDPYFISDECCYPFWHLIHYVVVAEQLYHASIKQVRDNDKFKTLENPQKFRLSKPISFRDSVSVEFIWQPRRQTERYQIEDCFFSFYSDKDGEVKGQISARTFVGQRSYIQDIERLKQGDKEVLEKLVRKIEAQAINHQKLINPRQNLEVVAGDLISQLKQGIIPEAELHDFFSFWD